MQVSTGMVVVYQINTEPNQYKGINKYGSKPTSVSKTSLQCVLDNMYHHVIESNQNSGINIYHSCVSDK